VIDDSANAREIFHGLLCHLGTRPALAASAHDGLAELERCAHTQPYDLVLMDWKMPDMDGFEAARAIRRMPLTVQPRIVLVSAHDTDYAQERVELEQLDGRLVKPVSETALLAQIERLFSPADDRPTANPRPATVARGQLQGLRILLVEDNELNQQLAQELLSSVAGAEVTMAGNGLIAMETLRNASFDLVLMDVQMPVMSGHDATRCIRAEISDSIPIIAMTANAMRSDREHCLAAGMNDYVSKPFDPAELFTKLAKWGRQRQAVPTHRSAQRKSARPGQGTGAVFSGNT
jgi:CheY-like chemotaxis protein